MWLKKSRAVDHACLLIRKVSFGSLVNGISLIFSFFLSRLLKRPVLIAKPWFLSLEPSGVCNLQCPECPVGAKVLNRAGGMLPLPLFKNLMDQSGSSLRYLNFYFQGEPMMNIHLHEMVNIAAKKNIYTVISTNGHHLSEKRSYDLVNSQLSRIIISLDGITEESYTKYRKGGSLKKVMEGIENIVKARKELKSITPFIVVQFLVFKHNEHEIPELKQWCKEKGVDRLEIKSAQFNEFGNFEVEPPENKKFSRYYQNKNGELKLKGKIYNHCSRQWGGAVVSWDGKVAPCCYDKDLKYAGGNLKNSTFNDIWTGKQLNNFRKKILTDKANIDICKNCPEGRHWFI